uniref:hypothetical protein n=1 Tax=Gelidibacter sp. TaxID=2018083 RepID=UPI00404AD357
MAPNKIEALLEKYDNGETTLHEEQQLREYFAQEDVAPHLEPYRSLFQYYAQTKNEQLSEDVQLFPKANTTKTYTMYKWLSVAAIAVLMIGFYFQTNQKRTIDELSQEELLAYNQTMEVLSMVSTKFNNGKETLGVLNLVSEKLNEGAENVQYINEFSKATDKLIKE